MDTMRNTSLGQIIILIILGFFLFSDFSKIKNYLKIINKNYNTFINKKTGKKGVEPLTFGFGNQCSTN